MQMKLQGTRYANEAPSRGRAPSCGRGSAPSCPPWLWSSRDDTSLLTPVGLSAIPHFPEGPCCENDDAHPSPLGRGRAAQCWLRGSGLALEMAREWSAGCYTPRAGPCPAGERTWHQNLCPLAFLSHGRRRGQLESWGWVGAAPAPCPPRGVQSRRAEPKPPPLTLPVAPPPPGSPEQPPPMAYPTTLISENSWVPGALGGLCRPLLLGMPWGKGQGASGPTGSATGPLRTPCGGICALLSVPSRGTQRSCVKHLRCLRQSAGLTDMPCCWHGTVASRRRDFLEKARSRRWSVWQPWAGPWLPSPSCWAWMPNKAA